MQKKSLKEIIMKLYLRPKGENGLPLHPTANVEECMKSYDKIVGELYTEEEVENLIYYVCGEVARLQGIILNGNYVDSAYKKFKK